jgi:hypothetical protein
VRASQHHFEFHPKKQGDRDSPYDAHKMAGMIAPNNRKGISALLPIGRIESLPLTKHMDAHMGILKKLFKTIAKPFVSSHESRKASIFRIFCLTDRKKAFSTPFLRPLTLFPG